MSETPPENVHELKDGPSIRERSAGMLDIWRRVLNSVGVILATRRKAAAKAEGVW